MLQPGAFALMFTRGGSSAGCRAPDPHSAAVYLKFWLAQMLPSAIL